MKRVGEVIWNDPPEMVRAQYPKPASLRNETPSTTEHMKFRGNPGGPPPKAKYSLATDSEPVP